MENPLKLAELILNDTERWNADAIEQVLSTGKLKNVSLETPIPVLLLYWTAQVGDDGTVYFLPDVYERDQAVLKNLNGEFRLRKRPLIDNTQIESDEDRRRGSLG